MKQVLSLLLLLSFFEINAQDLITLRDGGVIKVIVKEVSKEVVKYNKWGNKTETIYARDKNDIAQIKYVDGRIEKFEVEKQEIDPLTVIAVPKNTSPDKKQTTEVVGVSLPVKKDTNKVSSQTNQLPSSIPKNTRMEEIKAFQEGASYLSSTYSFPSGFTVYGLNYEYGVSDEFGVGIGVDYASVPITVPYFGYNYYGTYVNYYDDRITGWGIRANFSYHFAKLLQVSGFDIIPSLSVGKTFISGYNTKVSLDGGLGLKYFVTPKFGLGVNISFGISPSSKANPGISMTFRLK